MSLISWLQGRFLGKETIEIKAEDVQNYVDSQKMNELCATEFFILVAVSIVSNIISKCEFRTCMDKKEVKDDEYYQWNYEPNINQSGSDFKKEIIGKAMEKNECLIVELAGQLFIADSFILQDENVLTDKIFTNVRIETLTLNRSFKMSEVIYIKLNNKNMRTMLNSVTEGYKRIAKQAVEDYETATGKKGIVRVDATAMNKEYNGKSFQEVYEDLLNNRFQKYFKSKNAVLPLFDGFEYEEKEGVRQHKSESKPTDFKNMLNEIAAKVALAFNIPPKFMTGDVEGMSDSVTLLLSICVDPVAQTISTAINKTRYKKAILRGCYMWVDTSTILHIDLFAVAEKIDKLIASGMCSIDELRKYAAMLELGTEESMMHFMTKNYGELEKGGKNDGNSESESGNA